MAVMAVTSASCRGCRGTQCSVQALCVILSVSLQQMHVCACVSAWCGSVKGPRSAARSDFSSKGDESYSRIPSQAFDRAYTV